MIDIIQLILCSLAIIFLVSISTFLVWVMRQPEEWYWLKDNMTGILNHECTRCHALIKPDEQAILIDDDWYHSYCAAEERYYV